MSEQSINKPPKTSYDMIREVFWLIMTEGGGSPLTEASNFKTMLGAILGNSSMCKVLDYFLEHGAATSLILISRLGLPKRTIHTYLDSLNSWGLIEPSRKAYAQGSIKGMAGRVPDIWQVPDATVEQVNEAIQLHRRYKSPKFMVAEAFGQSYLHDYLEPRGRTETFYRDLLEEAKAQGIKEPHDIASLACEWFNKETKVRAWR